MTMNPAIYNLEIILDFCDNIRQSDLSEEEQYSFVFSEKCSRRAFAIIKEMGTSLDYYDPDTSYEEDMDAFISALREKITQLRLAPEEEVLPREENVWQKKYNCL